jgi:putative membrane protein
MFSHDGAMWFGGGFMWLFWILVIVVIVLAIKFVASNSNDSVSSSIDESPMSILKKRYARGEIDEDEFNRRAKELEK